MTRLEVPSLTTKRRHVSSSKESWSPYPFSIGKAEEDKDRADTSKESVNSYPTGRLLPHDDVTSEISKPK